MPSNGRGKVLPNMRLKLSGALVLKEALVSCPDGHGLSSNTVAPASESPAAYAGAGRQGPLSVVRRHCVARVDRMRPAAQTHRSLSSESSPWASQACLLAQST